MRFDKTVMLFAKSNKEIRRTKCGRIDSIRRVVIAEVSKNLEMFMFLFDDILLLTKVKKQTKKVSNCYLHVEIYAVSKKELPLLVPLTLPNITRF